MDLEVAGLVWGGIPQKLPPGGSLRVFSVSISPCPVPSRRGHASSLQAGGVFPGPQEPEHPVCWSQPLRG